MKSPISSGMKVMAKINFFSKGGQTIRSRSQSQKLWYHVKGLATRKTQMKYESSFLHCLQVMAKFKFFVHTSNSDTKAMT